MPSSPWSYGFIGGIVVILYYSLLYIIDPVLLFDPWWYWGGYLFFLTAMISYLIRRRSRGLLKMRAVTNGAFRVFLLTSILYYIFHYILYTWIDPELLALQRETILSEMNESLRDQFKTSLQESEGGIQWNILLLKFAFNLIFGFILSAFLAPIFKRDRF